MNIGGDEVVGRLLRLPLPGRDARSSRPIGLLDPLRGLALPASSPAAGRLLRASESFENMVWAYMIYAVIMVEIRF